MTQVLHAAERNPVVRAEFHHQRFVIARGRVGGIWILLAALLILPSILMSIAFVAITGIALLQRLLNLCAVDPNACSAGAGLTPQPTIMDVIPFIDQSTAFLLCLALLLTMMIAMSIVVTFVNMALASNSIAREKQGKTWDTLRLTDIGAGRIVLGKWWASLRALNGDYIMVTIMRLGFVSFYLASAGPALQALRQADAGITNGIQLWRSTQGLTPFPMLFILTLIYSALDAALTAALGVFSALPDEATVTIAGSAALLVRFATLIGAAVWMYFSLEMAATAAVLMGGIGISVYVLLIAAVLLVARRSVG